jgi:hypothetical protein
VQQKPYLPDIGLASDVLDEDVLRDALLVGRVPRADVDPRVQNRNLHPIAGSMIPVNAS